MDIMNKLKEIKAKIPKNVILVGVSKTKPIQDIRKAYEFGLLDFAENKVQELVEKEEALPKDIRWHFIGKLQTNKVKYLVGKTYLIHSLDSIKLLEKIEKEYSKKNLIANVLIQINIGKEESKSGIFKEDLYTILNEVEDCSFVKVKGLMAIIPKGTKEENRYYFKEMKNIFENIKRNKYKNIIMEHLSLGMSNDYNEAIEEGSTMVRIGQGIFGKRDNLGGIINE